MRIVGRKMASVFQRYRIVADDNVRAALELKTPTSWSAATYGEVHVPSRSVSLIKEASEGGATARAVEINSGSRRSSSRGVPKRFSHR